MRLFTGISITPHVLDELDKALGKLHPPARIRWSPPENLHVTLKFIGEWPEARLAELECALRSVPVPEPLRIKLTHFGFFPNPDRPKTFLLGVDGGPALPSLKRHIDEALVPLGCAPEERPYVPHLTLGRIKDDNGPGRNKKGLREARANAEPATATAKMTNFDFGTFEATRFHLYLSKPGPAGSVYTVLASFPEEIA
jgi:2'-5' RNA ligase